jgi:hypothetical protein
LTGLNVKDEAVDRQLAHRAPQTRCGGQREANAGGSDRADEILRRRVPLEAIDGGLAFAGGRPSIDDGGGAELGLDAVDDVVMMTNDALPTGGAKVLDNIGHLGDRRVMAHPPGCDATSVLNRSPMRPRSANGDPGLIVGPGSKSSIRPLGG